MPESTADIGAVSRTDKFGHSMPILKPHKDDPIHVFSVYHENQHMGNIYHHRLNDKWYAVHSEVPFRSSGPHENRHQAATSLFSPIDPAARMDRTR